MRYYVTADPHGFLTELKNVLEKQGFFTDPQPHKLIICGDLFDRGTEAVAMQEFILDLLRKDQVILIRGNHEDLAMDLLNSWHLGGYLAPHHRSNGTVDTVFQLTNSQPADLTWNDERIGRRFLNSTLVQRLIPEMVDYFETPHYIFVHGWIPSHPGGIFMENWRQATGAQWARARWVNGMDAAHNGLTEPGKTVVCGHWHCSYGHAVFEGTGTEFGKTADFSPYYGNGIIALDACTAASGQVNCIVIED